MAVRDIYRLISAALVLVLASGSLAGEACWADVCSTSAECAVAHCGCCGRNCPLQNPGDTQKHKANCNGELCPVIAGGKAVTISSTHASAALMFRNDEAERFAAGFYAADFAPIASLPDTPHSTLLSMGCALTV